MRQIGIVVDRLVNVVAEGAPASLIQHRQPLVRTLRSASPSLRAFSASASGASHWGPAARVRAAAAGVWAGTRHGARITAAKSRVLWSFIPTFPIGPELHFSLLSVDRRAGPGGPAQTRGSAPQIPPSPHTSR